MFLVQMLLPLYDNDGRRVPATRFRDVLDELTARFGGATAYVRSPAQGTWREDDGAVDRDDVVMCEVLVEALDRDWWKTYRGTLEERFGQQELMLRALDAERL